MDHATQIALTRRVLDCVDRNATELAESVYRNPVSSYTCPRQAEREREVLFRGPLFFGLSCELAKPGDWRADDLSGVPILVVRGPDGALRAFLNVCRHRGAKVASGSGSGRRVFVCPYHAFTYDLDGRLVRLDAAGFPGLACEELSLVPVPVAERHGLVFVTARPGAPAIDVDELLGGLAPEIASYGLEDYSHYRTATLAKDMNWKLVIDTFLETWHVATLHKATVAPIFQPNLNLFDAFGRNGRMVIPRRTILGLREIPEASWDFLEHSAIVYTLFPNALLVWQGDHFETWRAFPAGADAGRCVAEAALYTPAPADSDKARRHWDRNFDLLMATVDAEDFPVCIDIQRGFSAGAQSHITFGRNEPALGHYHRSLRRALGLEA